MAAAENFATLGVSVEVIDLQTLQPWDERTVIASLARTHRLVIVHEAVEAFGIGAEIAARVAAYVSPPNADLTGVLKKYARVVSSASHGAITI